jgi:hypothetical protein
MNVSQNYQPQRLNPLPEPPPGIPGEGKKLDQFP